MPVHYTFHWGSRKFPLEVMPAAERTLAESVGAILGQESAGSEIVRYNGAAYLHEHLVSKYCTLLGTSFAAIVAYEDRVALNYLRSRADVDPNKLACVGLSGGGARAALLRATSDDLDALPARLGRRRRLAGSCRDRGAGAPFGSIFA